MKQMTLEAELCRELENAGDVVEFRDPSGKLLGSFVPVVDQSKWKPVTDDVSEEELDRRETAPERFTTKEVLDHLQSLDAK